MADLLSAMVAASKGYAQPIAQSYASGNRPYLVRLTRVGAASYFDRTTKVLVNPPDVTLYTGPARIFPVTGPVELELGDERQTFSSARISIDNYTGSEPRVDDLVEVLDNAQAQLGRLVGRVFTVNDVEAGGHFDIGWELTTTGVAPSRRT